MWDPKEARDRLARERKLSEADIEKAKKLAEFASDRHGAAIREAFGDKGTMRGAMQTMDLTTEHMTRAFVATQEVDEDVTTHAVCLGLMLNLVIFLRTVRAPAQQIFDVCSRAIELAELFEESMIENFSVSSFDLRSKDEDDED